MKNTIRGAIAVTLLVPLVVWFGYAVRVSRANATAREAEDTFARVQQCKTVDGAAAILGAPLEALPPDYFTMPVSSLAESECCDDSVWLVNDRYLTVRFLKSDRTVVRAALSLCIQREG